MPELIRRLKPARPVLALALCVGALTACADKPADDQKSTGVVTFQSGPAASNPAPKDPDSRRPQLRLDMTDDEEAGLYDAWMQCLKDAGVPLERTASGHLIWTTNEAKEKANTPAVHEACDGKEPLIPAELDPDRNPYYEEDRMATIRCEIAQGIPWESNGGKYDYPPDITDPKQLEIRRQCRIKNMNGKRG
jgi:hypothetical protein